MWVRSLTGGAQSPFFVAEPGEVSKRLGEAAWPLPHAGGEAFHMSAPLFVTADVFQGQRGS